MNQKRAGGQKSKLVVSLLVVGIFVALGAGIYIGKQGQNEGDEPKKTTEGGTPAADPAPAPKRKLLSPAEVAKEKNVPEVLEDPAGDYTLVSVLEGAEANRKLTQNLQTVGAQRQRLLALAQQVERLPAAAVAQRELLSGEVLQLRRTLEQNLRFMAQSYGYSLKKNYRLVPHAATMLEITTGEDGKPKGEVAHEFTDAVSYQNFEAMREEFLILSVAEARKHSADVAAKPAVEAGEAGVIADELAEDSGSPAEFEPSEELKTMARDLASLYGFDPKKSYQINLNKTALYARAAKSQ